METLLQDIRHAFRGLTRTPGFAAIAILCLALGIGVNSFVFSIADSVSWRPLPFRDAERLVVFYSMHPANNVSVSRVSYPDFRDWKEQTRSFSEIAAYSYQSISLTEGVESERFQGSAITWNLFRLLDVRPLLGRDFREQDDQPGAAPVVLLSHGVWQRRYAGNPSIVGRSLLVNGTPHVVAGVMPPDFQFPQVAQIWVPVVPLAHAAARSQRTLLPAARLADGVSLEMASRDLADVADRLARAHPADSGWTARAASLRDELMPTQLQFAGMAMMGAVSLVLLIACANVANLMLARATSRQREMAVRTALGAGRGRLFRQLLTESALLGVFSAPLGVLIAHVGLGRMMAAVPPTVLVPYYIDWTMNPRVVIFTTAVSLLTGLLFGLAPAFQAGRLGLAGVLKDGGRGSSNSRTRTRLRNTLVVSEVALSLVLLVGSLLFVRSFINILGANAVLDTTPLMTMRVFMAGEAYGAPNAAEPQEAAKAREAREAQEAMTRRIDGIVRQIETIPGVAAAFASNLVPLSTGGGAGTIVADGLPVEPGREPRVSFFAATAHALETLAQPLVEGRDFTAGEAASRSGVAIVNGAFARRIWPGRSDIVGRRFRFTTDKPDEWLSVIGTVADFHTLTLGDRATVEPLAILPYPYQATRDTGLTIRVEGVAPSSVTAAVRQAIGAADASIAVFDVRTGEEIRAGRAWSRLFLTWMFSIFGGVALFLAAVGIYGVLSYSVAQRTQEFGVRTALGASKGNIFALVLTQGARLAAAGIVLGSVGALMVTQLLSRLLFNVTPGDALSYGVTALILAAVTILAGLVPAVRATAVDPIEALRAD